MPEFSIITINYNNAAGLQKTIDSVAGQSYRNIEFIIIDGGSTDESRNIIEANAGKLAYWCAEKDNGVYNAMNKGIGAANGEYLFFLNSGDIFNNENVLAKISAEKNTSDIVYGNIRNISPDGKEWIATPPAKLSFYYLYTHNLPHQSTFIRRSLFEKLGHYNENNKIVSDWEFIINAVCKFNASYQHIALVVSDYTFDGISSKPENRLLLMKEREAILNSQFGAYISDYQRLVEHETALNKFQRSAAHRLLAKIISSPLYRTATGWKKNK